MLASPKTSLMAALFALGALGTPASAMPAHLGAAPAPTVQSDVQRTQGVSFYYNSRRHGPRYRIVRPGFQHYYGGHYYSRPYWTPGYTYRRPVYRQPYYRSGPTVSFGFNLGGGVPLARRGGAAHVAWCRDRYRTYDVRSDSFIARAGGPRVRCRSPY